MMLEDRVYDGVVDAVTSDSGSRVARRKDAHGFALRGIKWEFPKYTLVG